MSNSSDTPLVSILSPVYNEAEHIEEMIASVLGQSYSAIELILVDDGSTDNTVAIAKRSEANDPRVRVVDEGKLGKVAAFNRAFLESTGDVILLMGGDDVMPPNSIAARVQAVLSQRSMAAPKIAVFARLVTFSLNPKFDGQTIPRKKSRGGRSGGTIAMSRELAEVAFPIPSTLVAEDLWIGGVADSVADSCVVIPDIVLRYRIHPGNSNPRGQNFTKMTESIHERMKAYQLLADQRNFELPEIKREQFAILADLEDRRYIGDLRGVLASRDASVGARLRAASMLSPWLFGVRTRLFKLFSGW